MLESPDSIRVRLKRVAGGEGLKDRKNVILLGDGFNDGSLASIALAQIGVEARVYLGGFEEWESREGAPIKQGAVRL
jgi:3-mercaptopyruvate sulfurtransferase SseA